MPLSKCSCKRMRNVKTQSFWATVCKLESLPFIPAIAPFSALGGRLESERQKMFQLVLKITKNAE